MSKYNTGYSSQHPWSTSRKNAQVRAMGRYNRLIKLYIWIGALTYGVLGCTPSSEQKSLEQKHLSLNEFVQIMKEVDNVPSQIEKNGLGMGYRAMQKAYEEHLTGKLVTFTGKIQSIYTGRNLVTFDVGQKFELDDGYVWIQLSDVLLDQFLSAKKGDMFKVTAKVGTYNQYFNEGIRFIGISLHKI